MSLDPKFLIEEHRDARSFAFTDLTGEYDEEDNPGGFGAPNPTTEDVTETIIEFTGPNDILYSVSKDGYNSELEIFTEDVDYSGNTFLDGVYKFRVIFKTTSDEFNSEYYYFGFASIIAMYVIQSSLSYHPSNNRAEKEWILEQHRLLNNLSFSAQTGNLNYFRENLEQLQKIK